MARIRKADHPAILRMVDMEYRKVADVAAEYGCTPAHIYALLGKLRRAGVKAAPLDVLDVETPAAAKPMATATGQATAGPVRQTILPVALELFGGGSVGSSAQPVKHEAGRLAVAAPVPVQALSSGSVAGAQATSAPGGFARPPENTATITDLSKRGKSGGRGGIGASLARPGYGLAMRTADGDENVTPFRSLEDLLSAIKPALRAAARSPEAVWFSIRPIDLATIESDAA